MGIPLYQEQGRPPERYKEYYEDLSSSDQCILNDIYHNYSNDKGTWENFIIRYDNKVALKHWKIFFFLKGGYNEE